MINEKTKRRIKDFCFNGRTGQNVVYVKNYCSKCGHSMTFLTNCKKPCPYCGTMVYATKEYEFKDKLKKEILRHE